MDKPSKSPSRPQARHGHPGALGPVHPTRRSGGGGPCSCMRLPYCSPLGISWGSIPHSSSQSAPHSRETAANASSISLPGGTVGWLWNLRLEQGSRAILPNATRLTHRVSESTNEASQQRPGTRPNLPPTGRRAPPPPTRKPADWIPELQAPDDCVTQKPGRLPGSATLPGRLPGVIALPRSKCGDWPANSDPESPLTRIWTSPGLI